MAKNSTAALAAPPIDTGIKGSIIRNLRERGAPAV